jgi:hypothetical protein
VIGPNCYCFVDVFRSFVKGIDTSFSLVHTPVHQLFKIIGQN